MKKKIAILPLTISLLCLSNYLSAQAIPETKSVKVIRAKSMFAPLLEESDSVRSSSLKRELINLKIKQKKNDTLLLAHPYNIPQSSKEQQDRISKMKIAAGKSN